MPRLPAHRPSDTEGQAHLFFAGDGLRQLMAVSTTGCIAVHSPDQPHLRIFHWYFRAKGKELITLPPVPWLILWSCRAPWNAEPCGHISRLHASGIGMTSLDVRGLSYLAHLRCSHNPLDRLDCSNMAYLRTVDCLGCDLEYLNVDGCSRLENIHVGGNKQLRHSASDLLACARGEPSIYRQRRLTATSLFDL
jgi:hypothetical protein